MTTPVALTFPIDDGTVVVARSERYEGMEMISMPLALRERLGGAAAAAFEDVLNETGQAWREDVLTFVEERFERRLAEEMGSLRIDVVSSIAALKNDMVRELATTRTEILKWSFVFWIGQVAAVAGLLALALRFLS